MNCETMVLGFVRIVIPQKIWIIAHFWRRVGAGRGFVLSSPIMLMIIFLCAWRCTMGPNIVWKSHNHYKFSLNWLYINNFTTFKASNFQKISCEIVVVYSKIRCDFKIASTPLWRYISCKHTHAYLTPHQSFTSNEIQPQKCGIWRD